MSADHEANAEALDIALYGKPDIYTPPEEFMPRRSTIAAKLAELYPDQVAVDHKAEAESINDFFKARNLAQSDVIRLGQMNATLALVEQQRIANLIAFMDAEGGPYKDINDIPLGRQTAIAEIREGLALS